VSVTALAGLIRWACSVRRALPNKAKGKGEISSLFV